MKINFKIISLLLILCFFSIASAYAVDENVTNDELQINNVNYEEMQIANEDTDEILSENAIKTKTFTELENLINSAPSGDTISLDYDYEYNYGFNTNGIIIDKPLTINGNGHVLDGKNTGRMFIIEADNFILKNITFKNGYSSESIGAVWGKGNKLTISDCTFSNCYANGTSHPDARKVVGGAVYIYANNANIVNNKFISNSIRGSGAGIALDGRYHTIENNTFIENKALGGMNGGGILVGQGYQIIIRGNTFINNSAEMGGGAVELQHSENDLIENNKFIDNFGDYGGALSIYNTSYFKVSNNLFNGNHATFENSIKGLGGAIRVYLNNPTGKSFITNNNFYNSCALHYGSALYIFGKNLEISGNIFDNSSTDDNVGGTINLIGNTTYISNNVIKNTVAGRHGGAIEIDGNNNQIISNKIVNSIAGISGGAIYIIGNSNTIKNNNFTDTTAKANGGAIQVNGDKTTISYNKFSNTYAKSSGGAVYIIGRNAKISNNQFLSNIAKANGGAIRIDGTGAKINNNIFKGNSASKGIDIFIWSGTGSEILHNTFKNYKTLSVVTYGNYIILQDNNGIFEKTIITVPTKNVAITNGKFTVTLKNNNGNVISGKTIKFTVNGKTYKAKTNSKGQATVNLKLNKFGNYNCVIKFAKDSYNQASSKKVTLKVTKEATKLTTPAKTFQKSAKTKKVTITLKSASNKVLAKKKVTLTVNGKIYKATTNKNGQAIININLTKKGTYKYTVKFAGDKQYNTISKNNKIIIK